MTHYAALRAKPGFIALLRNSIEELNSAERHHEIRYDLPEGRGIIDLPYRNESGWIIINFKTDEVRSDDEAQSTIS
jgi:hypothetical protein